MFWKLVAVAVAQTVLFAVVYTVWRSADRAVAEGKVKCDKRMGFWEYTGYQFLVDLSFFAIAVFAVIAVFLFRRFPLKYIVSNISEPDWLKKFLGPASSPEWKPNKELIILLSMYSALTAFARFLAEAVKSFVNYEKYLYDTLPPDTARAIRSCPDDSDGESDQDAHGDNDGCPLNSDDLEEMSPGIGGKGLASRPHALARHAIRQSLVHWIMIVYMGMGAMFTWGLVEYLALLSTPQNQKLEGVKLRAAKGNSRKKIGVV